MAFELSGKLIEKYNEQQVTDKFKKREFVIEKNEAGFVDHVKFQLVQDKTGLIEPFALGDEIKVSFNIRGNKWNDNYFVNLQAWRLEKVGQQETAPPQTGDQSPLPKEEDLPAMDDTDDLPF